MIAVRTITSCTILDKKNTRSLINKSNKSVNKFVGNNRRFLVYEAKFHECFTCAVKTLQVISRWQESSQCFCFITQLMAKFYGTQGQLVFETVQKICVTTHVKLKVTSQVY